jgi:hypothetical protein
MLINSRRYAAPEKGRRRYPVYFPFADALWHACLARWYFTTGAPEILTPKAAGFSPADFLYLGITKDTMPLIDFSLIPLPWYYQGYNATH